MHNTASGNRRVALTVRAAAADWRPQQGCKFPFVARRHNGPLSLRARRALRSEPDATALL